MDRHRPTVHLAASAGGHIELLLGLRDTFSGYRRVWVTTPGPRAEQLRAERERVRLVPPMDQRHLDIRNPWRSLGLALHERPRLVVTSGAGVVATFAAASRALGARLVFVETMARVNSTSATARLLAPLSTDLFVQWPERLALSPRAHLCRPMLLDDISVGAATGGDGTFVAVGSHSQPFDRLLRAADAAACDGVLPAPVRAQTGVTAFSPRHLEATAWIDPEQFATRIRTARHVVCHAGAGVIASALRAGRRPLVMGRRREFDEHVDDHQTDLVDALGGLGLVVSIDGAIAPRHLEAADRPWPEAPPWQAWPDLRDALAAVLAGERP